MILMRLSENSTKTLYNTITRNHAKNENEVFKEYFLFLQNESRKKFILLGWQDDLGELHSICSFG